MILLNNIISDIDKWYQDNQEPPRPHMGASTLGHYCDRWKWLSFRWAVIEKFDGRILRLFERGQNEEVTAVQNLRKAGLAVTNCLDNQQRVSFGSHVSGSPDGIVHCLDVPHLLEIKTHGDKSFKDLQANGVYKSKPQHWAQIQAYMMGLRLTRALYYAVNKNTDHLHLELVEYDAEAAEMIVEHGKALALSQRVPEPISADPSHYRCKWCAAHSFCHVRKPIQERNCRTCAYSEPLENSTWRCNYWQAEPIPSEAQREGCGEYVIHEDLKCN